MADITGIQWTDSTFNPWWGCERVSPGCAHCYADAQAKRYGHAKLWSGEHRFFTEAHWSKPHKWNSEATESGIRRKVFCASMADVFQDHADLPVERNRLFDMIVDTPMLDWQLLTKRPENAVTMLTDFYNSRPDIDSPLPNLWLGTSIENARHAFRADILRTAPAALRFISAEPLLGSLFNDSSGNRLDLTDIDWIIVGGESGGGARNMDLDWAREIIAEGQSAGTSVFVKQFGTVAARSHKLRDHKGGNPVEWEDDLQVRNFPSSLFASPLSGLFA